MNIFKTLILIILIMLAISTCSKKESETDKMDKLYGKVKSVKEIYFDPNWDYYKKTGKFSKGKIETIFFTLYNDKGLKIEKKEFKVNPHEQTITDSTIWKYEYDNEGREIRKVQYQNLYISRNGVTSVKSDSAIWIHEYDSLGNLLENSCTSKLYRVDPYKYMYKYNDKNQMIESVEHYKYGRKTEKRYEYNDKGFKSKIYLSRRRDSDNYSGEINFKYDNRNNLIEEIYLNLKNNEIYRRIEKEYADNDSILRHMIYDSKGVMFWGKEYKYDDNGNIIEKIITDRNGTESIQNYKFSYDSNNRKIKEIINRSGAIGMGESDFEHIEYIYDHNDNIIEKISYNKKNKPLYKYKYVFDDDKNTEIISFNFNEEKQDTLRIGYDENNNWTDRFIMDDMKFVVREIKYYD